MPTNVEKAKELRELDAIAVRASVGLLDGVRESDLGLASPCAGWNLRELLAHMTVQHYGFATAASGDGDPKHWAPGPPAADPVADYRAAAEHVLRAFAADSVPEAYFPLPEFPGDQPFPAELALSFHFVDYVVHSWDVARTLDRPLHFDDRVLAAALEVARMVPNGEERLAEGAAFAPAVEYSGDSRLDEIMALLGRVPG